MLRMFTVILAGLVILAACSFLDGAQAPLPPVDRMAIAYEGRPLVGPDGSTDYSVQRALNQDAVACGRTGGEIRPVCLRGQPMCVIAFADAGRACTGKQDCLGRCIAGPGAKQGQKASGVCAPTNNPCGCVSIVEGGEVQPILCVD